MTGRGDDLASGLYRVPQNAAPPTRARYKYQDKCVALRCIPNLLPGSPVDVIIVEWSTDYMLLGNDGRHELVSVKHRDPGQHDWTFAKLKTEHVFRDLHAVWKAMGETGDFIFESNKGFDRELAPFVGHPERRPVPGPDIIRKLAGYLQADVTEVRRFLGHFILRGDPLPDRNHIDAVGTQDMAEVLRQLDMDPAGALSCFTALAERIAVASTEEPPDPEQRVQPANRVHAGYRGSPGWDIRAPAADGRT